MLKLPQLVVFSACVVDLGEGSGEGVGLKKKGAVCACICVPVAAQLGVIGCVLGLLWPALVGTETHRVCNRTALGRAWV